MWIELLKAEGDRARIGEICVLNAVKWMSNCCPNCHWKARFSSFLLHGAMYTHVGEKCQRTRMQVDIIINCFRWTEVAERPIFTRLYVYMILVDQNVGSHVLKIFKRDEILMKWYPRYKNISYYYDHFHFHLSFVQVHYQNQWKLGFWCVRELCIYDRSLSRQYYSCTIEHRTWLLILLLFRDYNLSLPPPPHYPSHDPQRGQEQTLNQREENL